MRKLFLVVPVAALILAACSEAGVVAPDGEATFQLVDGTKRIADTADDLVHAFATFTIGVSGGTVVLENGEPGVNPDGVEVGRCEAGGRFVNGRGRPQGVIPHQFCVTEAEESIITLEVINARRFQHNQNVYRMSFALEDELQVSYSSASKNTTGEGVMEAIALKNGVAFGKFVVDLSQFGQQNENLLHGRCYLGDEETEAAQEADTENWVDCLDRAIDADFYEDVGANPATDTPDHTIGGYIYWKEIPSSP